MSEINPETMVQKLVSQGIPEAIAVSMINSMLKHENKPAPRKKGNPAMFGESRKKQEITLIHEDTCLTCGNIVTSKAVVLAYPEEDGDIIKGIRNVCHNCPKYFESLDKEVLISLLMIQNHPDPDIRMLSNKHQIRLAHMKPAKDWVGYKISRQDMSKPEYDK